MNLSAAPAKIGVVVECLPQVVDRLAPRLRARINQDTDLGLFLESMQVQLTQGRDCAHLKHLTNSVEQPTMGVDLLLVLRLDHQDNLDRY